MKRVSLDELSFQDFAEVLHTTFQVLVERGDPVSLKLAAVTPQSAPDARFEIFSLLFSGPLDRPLGQKTHRLAHERLGIFDLFIVPVNADSAGREYEAVFNRRSTPGKV